MFHDSFSKGVNVFVKDNNNNNNNHNNNNNNHLGHEPQTNWWQFLSSEVERRLQGILWGCTMWQRFGDHSLPDTWQCRITRSEPLGILCFWDLNSWTNRSLLGNQVKWALVWPFPNKQNREKHEQLYYIYIYMLYIYIHLYNQKWDHQGLLLHALFIIEVVLTEQRWRPPFRGSKSLHAEVRGSTHERALQNTRRGSGVDFNSMLMNCDKLTWYLSLYLT